MKISRCIMLIAGVLLLINISYAIGTSSVSSGAKYFTDCALNATLVNQNPYPAQPDSYVDIVFQVSWLQNYVCNGSRFELVMSYPFSLDENNSLRILPTDTYVQDYKTDWMVPYHLRVDKDALDGDAEVEVRYSPGIWGNDTPSIKKFNITIEDARTAFDAVLQDIQGSDVSIAIANSGKYAANSVVVRIPQQEDFTVSGTDGQMVGNLASGDYTVVGFSISQKLTQNGFRNASFRNMSNAGFINQSPRKLKFDIYYTDNIGERRIVNMELPYIVSGNSSIGIRNSSATNGNFQGRTSGSAGSSSGILLVVAIACIAAVFIVYMKFFRHPKNKAEKPQKKDEVPDWIKKSRGK